MAPHQPLVCSSMVGPESLHDIMGAPPWAMRLVPCCGGGGMSIWG